MGGFSSGWHWIIVLIVVVLLFGGKKIPELAKGLGKGIKTFKAEMSDDESKKVEASEEKPAASIETSEKKEA